MFDLPPLDAEQSMPQSHFEQVVSKAAEDNSTTPSTESLTVPEVENPTIPEIETPTTPSIEAPTVPEVVQPSDPMPPEETEEASPTEEAVPTEGAEATEDATPTEEAVPTEEAETPSETDSTETSMDDEVVVEMPDNPTDDDLLNRAKEIQAIFADGFQWSDLGEMLRQSYDFIAKYQKMSAQEMKDAVVGIINHIIDLTDTPYLPDRFTDPLFKAMVPPFVDVFGHFVAKQVGPLPTVDSEKPSPEKMMEFAETIKETFSDGFQWSDLAVAVRSAIEFMGSFPFLSTEEKKDCVVEIVNHVIDITDTPHLPDSYVDPVFKSMVPSFVDVIFSKIF